MTYTLIAHTELTGTQSAIEFTSVPQTFTDLLLVLSARSNRNTNNFYTNGKLGINGSTTGYSMRNLTGQFDGSSNVVTSGTGTTDDVWAFTFPGGNTTAGTFGNAQFYFPNYRSSAAKTVSLDNSSEHNAQQSFSWQVGILAGLTTQTAAITSIQIGIRTLDSASFVQYSSATLYGVTSGTSGGVTVS
jgi:hypothetical protein